MIIRIYSFQKERVMTRELIIKLQYNSIFKIQLKNLIIIHPFNIINPKCQVNIKQIMIFQS